MKLYTQNNIIKQLVMSVESVDKEDEDSDGEASSESDVDMSGNDDDGVGTGDVRIGPLAIWSKRGKKDDAAWVQSVGCPRYNSPDYFLDY